MRHLLALALVLQFGGFSSVSAKPCPAAMAAAEHACCTARQGGAAQHVSGSCGCQMAPMPTAPSGATVYTAPQGQTDHGVALTLTAAVVVPAPAVAHNQDASPPGFTRGASLSRLSGSGFRC